MRRTHAILPLLLCLSLAAQDQKPDSKPAGTAADAPAQASVAETTLARACAVMQGLESVAFRSTEDQDPAMLRQLKKQTGGLGGEMAAEVGASISQGLVHLKLKDGHEVVSHGSRAIAREGEGEWRLHRGTLANGEAIPFVLDPQMLFEELARLPPKGKRDVRGEAVKMKGQPAELVTLEVHGKAAQALSKSGLLPRFQGGGGFLTFGPLRGMLPEPGATSYDLALWVDAQTGQVLRMRVRGYQEDPAGGNFTIQVAGPGGDGGEEDEDADEAKPAKGQKTEKAVTVKDGLPERSKKRGVSTFDYEIAFSAHGRAKVDELPAEAQQLLRLPVRR